MLLAMTDGFYRLVQPYGLHTDASLAGACAAAGLDALHAELRAYEGAGAADAALAVKQADDASAVAWHFSREERYGRRSQ